MDSLVGTIAPPRLIGANPGTGPCTAMLAAGLLAKSMVQCCQSSRWSPQSGGEACGKGHLGALPQAHRLS